MGVARAPEQRAAGLAEAIERADEREVAERLLFQTHARGELVEAAIGPVPLALGDDRLGLLLAETLHLLEANSDVVDAARALRRDRLGLVGHVPVDPIRPFLDDGLFARGGLVDRKDRDSVP